LAETSDAGPMDAGTVASSGKAYFIVSGWSLLFFLIGGAILLVGGLSLTLLTGLSATSDRVFAIEALVSGLLADLAIRRFFRKRLVVAPKIEIPLVYVWPLLCVYIFLARPFE